jgi:hypothetical protein
MDPVASKVYKEQRDRTIIPSKVSPHITGIAVNKQAAEDFNKYRYDADTGISALKDAISFSKKHSQANLKDRAIMETKVGLLMGPMRVAMGLGVMSDSDREFLKQLIGNPNKVFALKNIEQAKLGILLRKAENDLNTRAEQAGLKVGTPVKLDFKK